MGVVFSQISDDGAVEAIRPVVNAHPQAARATLRYVEHIATRSPGYLTNRALRILLAAMAGRPVAESLGGDPEVFERERRLGWLPLGEAYDELAAEVPELRALAGKAEALADAEDSAEAQAALLKISARALVLVGPCADRSDQLLNGTLAGGIATHYLSALARRPRARDVSRPLWERDRARPGAAS